MLALGLILGACQKNEDLLTADALTGGLVTPTSSIPYKLGATPKVNLSLTVPMGPGISKVEVFNKYYRTATSKSSNKVLMSTVDIASSNLSAELVKPFSITYADLIKGLTLEGAALPANEGLLPIGDKWELTYEAILTDGRRVVNNAKTTIAVANVYAGTYVCTGIFTHPVNGPRPINEEKFLTPLSAYSCRLPAGDLGGSGYAVTITVDPATNNISFSQGAPVDMYPQAGKRSYYDPATGKIYLSYFYVGATGNRLMDETYTPVK